MECFSFNFDAGYAVEEGGWRAGTEAGEIIYLPAWQLLLRACRAGSLTSRPLETPLLSMVLQVF